MGAVTVRDADNLAWTVQVQWRPRLLGLASKIGGWRKKDQAPAGGRHTGSSTGSTGDRLVDLVEPYPGWYYEPAPAGGGNGSGGLLDGLGSGGSSGGGSGDGWFDFGDLDEGAAIVLAAVVALIGVIAAAALFWWVLLPVLLVVLDGLAVVVLLVAGTLARVLLGRPWTVLAVSARGDRLTRQVVGWRNAARARDDLASELRNGSLRHQDR